MREAQLQICEREQICAAIADEGWCVVDQFLPHALTLQLQQDCLQLRKSGNLKNAGVGIGQQLQVDRRIRGDQTFWLDQLNNAAQKDFFHHCELLRHELNQTLFLGLEEIEAHYAHYSPGAFYRRHLDRFKTDDRRVVSMLLYLNADWQNTDAGNLRIYLFDQEKTQVDIEPIFNRAVFFLSADFYHEVLPAKRDRLSIAAWFKQRPTKINI